jgi:hypothetical protein
MSTLTTRALYLGGGNKVNAAGKNMVGKFGEGLKKGIASIVRGDKGGVIIETNGAKWNFYFRPCRGFPDRVLVVPRLLLSD